ncbi:MAG: hypothetical protein U0441_06050 [Polyangiaceae bacterium]
MSEARPVQTIRSVFPAFSRELTELLAASERPDLAPRIADLPVVDRCRCGDPDCAHFYTAPRPKGAYGEGHFNLRLGAATGFIVLDVVEDRIVAVEVLHRPDVKRALDEVLPLSKVSTSPD